MKKLIFGSAVALGCLAVAWADFTEDDIAYLRREAWQKVRTLQTYLAEVESPQDRWALVNRAMDYIYLYDITGASNAAEVLRMPYVHVIGDFETKRSCLRSENLSLRLDLISGTRRDLVRSYEQRGEMNPSHRLQELCDNAPMKRDWDPPFISAVPPDVDEEEFQRCYEIMGSLREVYWEAKLNPGQVVLPLEVREPFAYPTGISPYEDEERQVPNEAFFASWFRNIYNTLTREWDEEVWEERGEDISALIPTFF